MTEHPGMAAAVAAGTVVGVRFHGRGGQGVLALAEGLALAVRHEGHLAHAWSFGSQRTGAPLVCCCRVNDAAPVTAPIADPAVIVVRDVSVMGTGDILAGLRPDGWLLLDTPHRLTELGLGPVVAALPPGHAVAVPATELARTHLGRPLPNSALLGALAALTGLASLQAVEHAIAVKTHRQAHRQTTRRGAKGAVSAAAAAYALVQGRFQPAG